MSRDRIELPAPLDVTTAPAMPIRGHQIGYRPKTNSYDAWDLAQWEQYIRDLAVFGCNAIELIPPRSDDDADSPHFPLPQMEMMIGVSQLAADYGLDVWIWYPAMDANYSTPEAIDAAVKEWGEVLSKLPRVDALFVPSGDPGHAPPHELMAMLARQAEQLKRLHPGAGIWISVQSFTQPQFDEMLEILAAGAGVAGGHRPRSAGAGQRRQAARAGAAPISDSRLSRHHAQHALRVPGSRLGPGLRAHRRARSHQPAADGPDEYLSTLQTARARSNHLFRRLQRRCQQSDLEPTLLGSRRAADRHAARIQPVLYRRQVHRRFRPRPAGA